MSKRKRAMMPLSLSLKKKGDDATFMSKRKRVMKPLFNFQDKRAMKKLHVKVKRVMMPLDVVKRERSDDAT